MKLAIGRYLVPFFFLYKPSLALAGSVGEKPWLAPKGLWRLYSFVWLQRIFQAPPMPFLSGRDCWLQDFSCPLADGPRLSSSWPSHPRGFTSTSSLSVLTFLT